MHDVKAGERFSQTLLITLALLSLYFIWGSTYFAMRVAIDSFPPFMMAALRFSIAGALLYGALRLYGRPAPAAREWLGATAVGVLLLAVGNAGVAYAEKTVSTSIAALAIATVPMWMAIFSGVWGQWPGRREWLGIGIGVIGVGLLSLNGSIQASPLGAFLLLLSALAWAFGSVWGKRLPMPAGAMASATQMLAGGAVLVVVSLGAGEQWPTQPTLHSLLAMAFLVLLGSLVAYSAYLYLLKTVRPLLATSHTLVNPIVAIFLGAWLAGEQVGMVEYAALAIIMTGIALVLTQPKAAS